MPLPEGCEASVAFATIPALPNPLSELEGAGLLGRTELHLVQRVVVVEGVARGRRKKHLSSQ